MPPAWMTDSNTRNPLSLHGAVTSHSVRSRRRSGLSTPYLSIASAYVMRRSGSVSSMPSTSRHNVAMSPSIMFWRICSLTNDISMSICVNSGWRSLRRSSSRKQRTIWK